jgi:hypothetical protein
MSLQDKFTSLQEALWYFYDDPSNIEGNVHKAITILEEIVDSAKQAANQSEAAPNTKTSRR